MAHAIVSVLTVQGFQVFVVYHIGNYLVPVKIYKKATTAKCDRLENEL